MIKVSRKIEYALLALSKLDLTQGQGPLSARDLSEQCQLPYDTVAKILKALGQQNWVTSLQGAKGGYLLEIDLATVSYLDLAQVLDEKLETLACMEASGCELEHHCSISSPLKTTDQLLHTFFKNLSIRSIISAHSLLPAWDLHLKNFPAHYEQRAP